MIGKKRDKEACGCQTRLKEQRGWAEGLTLRGLEIETFSQKLNQRERHRATDALITHKES